MAWVGFSETNSLIHLVDARGGETSEYSFSVRRAKHKDWFLLLCIVLDFGGK